MTSRVDPRRLDDHMLEQELRHALTVACDDHDACLRGPCKRRIEALRAEARRRFTGQLGLSGNLMMGERA